MDVNQNRNQNMDAGGGGEALDGARALDGAIALLKGDSDESKFAGLLALVKHVPVDLFQKKRGYVLQQVGKDEFARFMKRLLVTGKDQGAYRKVAMAVLSGFCCAASNNGHDASCGDGQNCDDPMASFRNCVPLLLEAIESIGMADERGVMDGLIALDGILDATGGAGDVEKMIAQKASALITIVTNEGYSNQSMLTLQLLSKISHQLQDTDVARLATKFAGTDDEFLYISLSEFFQDYLSEETSSSVFVQSSRDSKPTSKMVASLGQGIFHVIQGRANISEELRNSALRLTVVLFQQSGPAWPFLDQEENRALKLVLLVKLVSVEINVVLTQMRYVLLEGKEQGEERLKPLVSCFNLLELFVSYLVRDFGSFTTKLDERDQWDNLDGESLLKIREGLSESYSSVVQFVCFARKSGFLNEAIGTNFLALCTKCLAFWIQKNGPDERLDEVEKKELKLTDPSNGVDTLLHLSAVPGCMEYAVGALADLIVQEDAYLAKHLVENGGSIVTPILEMILMCGRLFFSEEEDVGRKMDSGLKILQGTDVGMVSHAPVLENKVGTANRMKELFGQSVVNKLSVDLSNVDSHFFYLQVQACIIYWLHELNNQVDQTEITKLLNEADALAAMDNGLTSFIFPELRKYLFA